LTHHTTTCQLTHQHHLPHPHDLRHLPYLKVAALLSFLNAQSGSGLGAVGIEIPTARLHPWYLDLGPVPFLQLLLRIINQSYSVVSVFNQRQFLTPLSSPLLWTCPFTPLGTSTTTRDRPFFVLPALVLRPNHKCPLQGSRESRNLQPIISFFPLVL
jgi:hypothetical protein